MTRPGHTPPDIFGREQAVAPSYGAPVVLRQRSVLLMVLLMVVTLSLYGAWWLRGTARELNRSLKVRPISERFLNGCLLLGCVSLIAFGASLVWDDRYVNAIDSAVGSLYWGFLTIGSLRIRRRLLLLRDGGGEPVKAHLLLTVFFDGLYLQWSVNRSQRRNARPLRATSEYAFREPGCLPWLFFVGLPTAALGLLVTLVLSVLVVFWSGRIRYSRSVTAAAERVGDLEYRHMGTVAEYPGLHPVFALGQDFQLSDEEASRLKECARERSHDLTAEDKALIAAVAERHRELLRAASRLKESAPRPVGFDNLTAELETAPGNAQQPTLARFLFLKASMALDRRDAPTAMEVIRWLGWHASLLESNPALGSQLAGFYSESFQLRLIARMLSTHRPAAQLRDMGGALSPHDVRALHTRALALELARIRWGTEEILPEYAQPADDSIVQRVGSMGGHALALHAGAGAAEWILDYDDAYALPYSAGRARLDYDPDELSFLERTGLLIGVKAWWVPGRYRGAAESRELIARLLEVLQDPGVRDCSDLSERLLPNVERVRVEPVAGTLCRVRYASAEDYLATFQDSPGPTPPLEARVALPAP